MSRFRGVRLTETLEQKLKREEIDTVWIEGWRYQAFWQAARAARRCGLKILVRGESNDLRKDPRLRRVLKSQVIGHFVRQFTDVLSIGSSNRRFYEHLGVPQSKLHSAPYCVDNQRFQKMAAQFRPDRDDIRRRWNIAVDAKVLLFCGKLISK